MVQTRSQTLHRRQNPAVNPPATPIVSTPRAGRRPRSSAGPARNGRMLTRSRRRGPYAQAASSTRERVPTVPLTPPPGFPPGNIASASDPSRPSPHEISPLRALARTHPRRWTQVGTCKRLVLVEDKEVPPEVRARQNEEKRATIFRREYYQLVLERDLRQRMVADGYESLPIDSEDEGDDSNRAGPSGTSSFNAVASSSSSSPNAVASSSSSSSNAVASSSSSSARRSDEPRARALGPNGTHLVFDYNFMGMANGEDTEMN